MIIIFLIIIVIISFLIYFQSLKKKNVSLKYMDIIKSIENLYPQVKLKSPFNRQPNDKSGLRFGYICPGAIKTVTYLNQKSKTAKSKKLTNEIKRLTDALFFIEIIIIYQNYISKKLYQESKKILANNGCIFSNQITQRISDLFSQYPKDIKTNLPDDFYHIRHNTLICSNNRKLAEERINLLKSIYS